MVIGLLVVFDWVILFFVFVWFFSESNGITHLAQVWYGMDSDHQVTSCASSFSALIAWTASFYTLFPAYPAVLP